MDLGTSLMGIPIGNPLVVGASPLTEDVGAIRACEDAGAGAVIMHSLFMEQIAREQLALVHDVESHEHAHPEASSYHPAPRGRSHGTHEYLEQVRLLKQAVSIPVIASLNGVTTGYWTHHAALLQQAGADGIELNVYYLPLDAVEDAAAVEQRFVDILASVKSEVDLPVAMKLTPFFTSPVHTLRRLRQVGADGFVLFNRLFHPQIDVENLEVHASLQLSDPSLLELRLLWLAAAFGQVDAPMSVSGGVSEVNDVLRAVMAGASSVQMTSALLSRGPGHLRPLRDGLIRWMEEHQYSSLQQMCGSMSRLRCPDPEAYERANYIGALQLWRSHR
jgi:dihydroorotate dehydrogenase (fumarate)